MRLPEFFNQTQTMFNQQNLNLNHRTTMTNMTTTHRSRALRFAALCLGMLVLFAISTNSAFAQTVPPANTNIGNQASASYIDNGGTTQNVTSNTVVTIVQQVAGVTISAGVSRTVSPGGQITFTHTITNTGNGTDAFDLTAIGQAGDFVYTNISIFPDADLDGIADNFTPITVTPPLTAFTNNTFGIVIVADVPASATDGQSTDILVTASSDFDDTNGNSPIASDNATNTTTVEEDAVVNISKSASATQADVGDTITFTFNISNNGNSNAANITIRDAISSDVTYVAGTGLWSGSVTPLTDAAGGDPVGITYEFKTGGAQDSVIATISNLNSGAAATLEFDVTIDAGTEGNTIFNTGVFTHDDLTTPTNTNTTETDVNENFDVIILDTVTITEDSVDQGATVDFLNRYRNVGTAQDTYNITITEATTNFPVGTTFTLFQTDGNGNPTSPYTDTGTDGIPDTGPVAVGDTVEVVLRVNLPSGVSGGPYSIDKTLTSLGDPAESATHTDELEGIFDPTVDLTNNAAFGDVGALGEGDGPEAAPVVTESTNPGATVTFNLFVENTSAQTDEYDFAFATDTTAGGDIDAAATLPAGWTLEFRDPNNGNSVVSSTPSTLAPGASFEYNAVVTIPAGFSPGDVELYFRVQSPNTGAKDIIHDRVTVNTEQVVSLVSGNTGQVAPGGSRNYLHTFTVNSNVTENNGTNSDFQIELTNSVAVGWTAVVYWDRDGDGIVDTGVGEDSLLTSAADAGAVDFPTDIGTLQFGDQVRFIVVVSALAGLNDGASNTTTITVSDTQSNLADQVNTDITEVQAGLLVINKTQAPAVGGVAGTYATTQFNVLPGDTVFYRLVATNDGSQPITNVIITDVTPSFTKQLILTTTQILVGTIGSITVSTEPGVGTAGTIQITIDQLDPTESVQIDFAVRVDGGS